MGILLYSQCRAVFSHCPGRSIRRNGPVFWSRRLLDLSPAECTCTAIWRAPFTPDEVTHGTNCGMPFKLLGRQHTTCLMSFSGPGILVQGSVMHWLSWWAVSTYFVNRFNWPAAVLFTANNSYPQLLYVPTFLSSCFLLPYLANVAVAILYDRFRLPVNV
jgi:hypothetical protein